MGNVTPDGQWRTEAGDLVRLAHRPHDPAALRIIRVGGTADQRADLMNGEIRFGRELVSMSLAFWADWLLPDDHPRWAWPWMKGKAAHRLVESVPFCAAGGPA